MNRILTLMLAVLLALSMTACGGQSEAAKAVDDQIDAIGEVTLDSESAIGEVTLDSAAAVEAAQEVYDALSSADQAKVSNAGDLNAAAQKLKELKQQAAESLLAGMSVENDEVRNMSFYYPKGYPQYVDTRCYVLPYIGRDKNSVWLRLMCDYTGGDWVFFEKITFAVDDDRYVKLFSYRDVVRDNQYGNVWEYVDVEGEEYVDILNQIADSTKTVIRFEGDDHYFDFTVKDSDKQAIRQVLTAYEALK